MSDTLRVAIIGLGEAGSLIGATLLAGGADVVAFDSKPSPSPAAPLAASMGEAVADADLVISVNSATAAYRIAQQVAPHLKPGALFADMNTGNPGLKERLAAELPEGALVDVAIMGSVSELGSQVPMLVSGPRAEQVVQMLTPFGLDLDIVSTEVGAAAARALTRSLVSKFVASALIDYLWTAHAMGLEDWAYDELLVEFENMNADTATRLMREVVSNPKRREIEMLDIVEMLDRAGHSSLFVPPTQLVYNKVYHSIKVPHVEKD